MTSSIDVEIIQRKISSLSTLLQRGRYRLGNETQCQEDVASWLEKNKVPFKREHTLKYGIVDFYLPRSKIALELKVAKKWGKLPVFRQCEKYCKDESVHGLLLATGAAMSLPQFIDGKPVSVFLLNETSL